MTRIPWYLLVFITLAAPAPARGHSPDLDLPVVIDTDAGLDDVVALALALQCPELRLAGVVVTDGVLGAERGAEVVERLLVWFNRREVPLYTAPAGRRTSRPPTFRKVVEQTLLAGIPEGKGLPRGRRLPFGPEAYAAPGGGKTTVLVLGPMSSLARALASRPAQEQRVARVIALGAPGPSRSWNARFDPGAWEKVERSGLPVEFLVHGPAAKKPAGWASGKLSAARPSSPAARLLSGLLSSPQVAAHYVQQLPELTDELALLYLLDRDPFVRRFPPGSATATVHPAGAGALLARFASLLDNGRQLKQPVVLAHGDLAPAALQADLRPRMQDILAKNGEVEWRAQLVQCELHQHLGIHSIIGVKMGLRAAELLNAPQHGMKVTSLAPSSPPASCLDDGLIAAVGSTPGRGLFQRGTADEARVRARFQYNGRTATLTLVKARAEQVADLLRDLRASHGLSSPEYWASVRKKGLEVWEDWHRAEIFEEKVEETP